MTGEALRKKRAVAGIPGSAICQLVKISRAKLSGIETGSAVATTEELQQIQAAIESIVQTRRQLAKLAADSGLSLAGVRI